MALTQLKLPNIQRQQIHHVISVTMVNMLCTFRRSALLLLRLFENEEGDNLYFLTLWASLHRVSSLDSTGSE